MRETKDQQLFREYGYTNDQAALERVQAFVAAAIADGWEQSIYFEGEPVDQACKLRRDGFVMSVLSRTFTPTRWQPQSRFKFTAQVSAWGPDELALDIGPDYPGFEAFQAALLKCLLCGAEGVVTQRYGFAGRCCAACLPAARAKFEKPGWCD